MLKTNIYRKLLKECVAFRLGIIDATELQTTLATYRALLEEGENSEMENMLFNLENKIEEYIYTLDKEESKNKIGESILTAEEILKGKLGLKY